MNQFQIKLRLWPSLITVFLLCVLVGLGTWQLERKVWKENLITEIEARRSANVVDIAQIDNAKDWNYQPVFAVGTFQGETSFLMPMISLKGEGGYALLTPFKLQNGGHILVNRGWIPYQDLDKKYAPPAGAVTIKGLMRTPTKPNWLTPANQPERGVWYSYDLPAMAKAAGIPVLLPMVIDVDATPNEGGYPMGGQTRLTLSNNHMGYAVTWFGLAIVLLVVYGVSAIKTKP